MVGGGAKPVFLGGPLEGGVCKIKIGGAFSS